MTKTFKELQEVDAMIAGLYRDDPLLKDTKFGYAYTRFHAINYAPMIKKLQEALTDARIDNALINEDTKALLTDPTAPRGFKYSKEGLKAVIKAEAKISDKFDEEEIEITPYLAPYLPDLTESQVELLTGLLL